MLGLLGNPTTDEEKDMRVRREDQSPEVLTTDDLDFIAVFFVDAAPTKNYMVNKGYLIVDYYTSIRYNAKLLSERVAELLQGYDEIKLYSEGQAISGITGIYKYRQRYNPLVRG
jgi:hypothetical protein